MLTCRNDMLELTKQLVQMESIVNTKGEKAFAESLYDMIMKMPYFKQNPSHVVLAPTVNDERDRYNVMAFVKGTKGKSKQDRKSTRLNSSHVAISYAVFCLKKKRKPNKT